MPKSSPQPNTPREKECECYCHTKPWNAVKHGTINWCAKNCIKLATPPTNSDWEESAIIEMAERGKAED